MREARQGGAQELARVVGLPGAVLLGLGSILGTGIFVSIGVAAEAAGAWVVAAVVLGAVVATFNGLSSAQLAANHPVSGGTYEYGYRFLNPLLGFLAGWMFLAAKSASAATAALGLAGYVLTATGHGSRGGRVALGLAAVALLTALVAGGMRRSNRANALIVSFTLLGLAAFVLAGALWGGAGSLPAAGEVGGAPSLADLLRGTALMFVAYTGYGRIATLGEEVRDPSRTIPRAIVATLVVTLLLYTAVTWMAVRLLGPGGLAEATLGQAAPLEVAAGRIPLPGITWLVGAAAVTAMAGVLLNLLLGLSRVALAMARRGDLPAGLATVDVGSRSPARAVVAVGVVVACLVAVGNVRTTWSFSAFTVLVYYALTNLAALRLSDEERRFPRAVPALGLVSCLGLAFWVEPAVWMAGLGLLAVGVAWHAAAGRLAGPSRPRR